MAIREPLLRHIDARFQRHPLSSGLKLTAKRDLFSKSLWGCAYSQAVKRARDGKLACWSLDPNRSEAVGEAFRVSAQELHLSLLDCLPGYDQIRESVREALREPPALIALSGSPGPARDAAMLAVIVTMSEVLGRRRKIGVLQSHAVASINHKWLDARFYPARRAPGRPFCIDLRKAIRRVQRLDADAVGFLSIDNPVVAREVGELIAGARAACFVVADHADLIGEAMRYAGIEQREGFHASVSEDGIVLLPLQVARKHAAEVFISAPARSAGYLLRYGLRDCGALVCGDDLIATAAQITLDEVGRLANKGLAHADMRQVLSEVENGDELAGRLIELMLQNSVVDSGDQIPFGEGHEPDEFRSRE